MFLFLTTSYVAAQESSCSALVTRSLAEIEQHCADFARNSICYGYPQVDVAFADGNSAAAFSVPGDRARIADLARVRTSALDEAQSHWGVALLNLGANFPQTYEGPGLLVLQAGDAEVVNEIDPSRVMAIGKPLSTVALVEATRFKLPGVIPEPLGTLAADELLLVDAYDNSGNWLRVVNDGMVSWVESEKLARLKAMQALPRIGVGETFPFQSLSLATGSAFPECSDAEPIIAIQTPEDMPVNLTVNGVDIHIGSMVTFQQVHRNALSMTVHRGEVTTIFGGTVRAGESVLGILVATAERESHVLEWSGALPAAEGENARGQRAQDALNRVARVNGWDEHEIAYEPPPVIHVVGPGEGLYRIATWYDTSVAEIIEANQLKEPLILYRGQELEIPNPGSGFAGLRSVPVAVPVVTLSASDDCAGLRLTSPLAGAPGSASAFYWDGVPAAEQYLVNIYDHSSNARVGNLTTGGSETTLTIAIGQLGVGGEFRWEVHALAGGSVICSTGMSQPMPHWSS